MEDYYVVGIGVEFWATITFVILKLTHVISWSWWWVFAPLWGGVALTFAWVIFSLFIGVVGTILYWIISKIVKDE